MVFTAMGDPRSGSGITMGQPRGIGKGPVSSLPPVPSPLAGPLQYSKGGRGEPLPPCGEGVGDGGVSARAIDLIYISEISSRNPGANTPTPDPSPQGGGELRNGSLVGEGTQIASSDAP